MYTRVLDLSPILALRSCFLFGPRQTGKSTYLKKSFPNCLYINLLSSSIYRELSTKPENLEHHIGAFKKNNPQNLHIIVIDETLRIPDLLNEVHKLIEDDKSLRFILTGSSPRKLRSHGNNLLGGRASFVEFLPITSSEISTWQEKNQTWKSIVNSGGIPSIVSAQNYSEILDDYIDLYIKEEIEAEKVTRKIPDFVRFINTIALMNGEQVNFENIASDCQVKSATVRNYIQILEDTLFGRLLLPYQKTVKRAAVKTAKFYLFDLGVWNKLLNRSEIIQGTPEFGHAIEHFIFLEIFAYNNYSNKKAHIYYWRTYNGLEVDFIIETSKKELIAIEIKTSTSIRSADLHGIKAFSEENTNLKKIIVYFGEYEKIIEKDMHCLPIDLFLQKLWGKSIF